MKRQAYTNKLLVLGVDGMDPRISKRMMDDGRMPNLKAFREKVLPVTICVCWVLSQPSPLHAGPLWLPVLTQVPMVSPATGVSLQTAWTQLYTTWTPETAWQNRCGMLPLKLV